MRSYNLFHGSAIVNKTEWASCLITDFKGSILPHLGHIYLLLWDIFLLFLVFFLGFYHERMLSFAKDLSVSVDMIMLFLYLSIFIVRTIPGLLKRNVVYCGVYDLVNVLLNLVCKYFIEKFCIYVHNGNQATICWLLLCFIWLWDQDNTGLTEYVGSIHSILWNSWEILMLVLLSSCNRIQLFGSCLFFPGTLHYYFNLISLYKSFKIFV